MHTRPVGLVGQACIVFDLFWFPLPAVCRSVSDRLVMLPLLLMRWWCGRASYRYSVICSICLWTPVWLGAWPLIVAMSSTFEESVYDRTIRFLLHIYGIATSVGMCKYNVMCVSCKTVQFVLRLFMTLTYRIQLYNYYIQHSAPGYYA